MHVYGGADDHQAPPRPARRLAAVGRAAGPGAAVPRRPLLPHGAAGGALTADIAAQLGRRRRWPADADVSEPIAIVGIACRFPGGADDPDAFWDLAGRGRRRDPHRSSATASSSTASTTPRRRTPGRMMTRWGGFLDDVEQFDADFFGIAPARPRALDPPQRLLLETTWEASRTPPSTHRRSPGRPVGRVRRAVVERLREPPVRRPRRARLLRHDGQRPLRHAPVGCRSSSAPPVRASPIDTACSSSLVAVHLACQSLRTGESSLAIAGRRQRDPPAAHHASPTRRAG